MNDVQNKKKILIVDDQPNNLQLLRQILKDTYSLLFAINGEKALELNRDHKPDLVLLDIMMPGMDGYEVCKLIHESSETKNTPIIFISAMNEIEDEAKGFEVGAVDFIHKPISAPVVLHRVQTHLSLVKAHELQHNYCSMIAMLGEAGHYNDSDTGAHIWRMASYSRIIAESLGWSQHDANLLGVAAVMHDTGKIGIPDSILKAPRSLTDDEWDTMKTHTLIGHKILSMNHSPLFNLAAEIALNHHEKWDGSGYPSGLSKETIPESGRIVAVADVFDALTMKRPYKEAWSTETALIEIQKNSGSHFDPNVVEAFSSKISEIIEIKRKWEDNELSPSIAHCMCPNS